jgi:hypothetical protein
VVEKIRAREIQDSDIDAVLDLLKRGFVSRPRAFWHEVLTRLPWCTASTQMPKYGYLLECDARVVGVILLISSRMQTASGSATRCNVSSWYVEPDFRAYASLLVAKALGHKDVTYLNVTAAPHTRPMLKAQGYAQYSKGVFVCAPALRFSLRDTPAKIFAVQPPDPTAVDPHEGHLLEQHAEYGCFSLWCVTPERAHPFVFRPRLAKGVVPCAQLIYCADIADFARFAGPIGRWLALRGRPFVIVDSNGPIRGLIGKYFDGVMPKYFKGPSRPRLGDLAYTETAIFGV